MDKLFSMLGAVSPPTSAHDDQAPAPYIMPSFSDNYDAWAYPETQQAVFEDWVATAAPPPTALASPCVHSPALSASSSSGTSTGSSPTLGGDITLDLASTLKQADPLSLSVADYAAALFPDIAASLVREQSPAGWDQSNLAGMLAAVTPAGSPSPTPSSPSPAVAMDADARKRRDAEFLESLPPQLRLKRRRTSNTKQKEKILAELMQPEAPAAAAKPRAVRKAPVRAEPAAQVAAPSSDDAESAAAHKRQKNTDAARRSRMRKILRIETLEGRVSELESENARLARRIAELEADQAQSRI
ncbi:hypothetical protein GGF46_001099 [Coemansia sp. RSA 552]|nr:hypothetical protein GGF46_001099 [Coemansia sp. RSA 552]